MLNLMKKTVKSLPPFRNLYSRIQELEQNLAQRKQESTWVPPGHFYSPIPCTEEIKKRQIAIFDNHPKELPGIDLREQAQLELLDELTQYYKDQPFTAEKQPDMRYFYENSNYSYSDGFFLHATIRHRKPKKIIEIGSGYSSACILDTNERFFDNKIECIFMEPYPQLLHSLLKPGDRERVRIEAHNLQDIDHSIFQELEDGDILFVDSTHVSKTDSDVNHLIFSIFPRLKKGVHIHVHDIFYPFEYIQEWVMQGRSWNEAYILRAFLQYNSAFQIEFFNTFLNRFHKDTMQAKMPLCVHNWGGHIWLRKVQ